MLTKFGLSNIIVMLAVSLILMVSGSFALPRWWAWLLIGAGILLMAFTFIFFRDPPRPVPEKYKNDESLVLSPTDGKVVEIVEEEEPYYLKGKSIRISIFLSPLDLHVNYSPVTGKVEYYEYTPGQYLVAYHPKSSELNEHTKIGVMTAYGKVFYKQIVGIVARRLVCILNKGDSTVSGEQIGMMKFGSRMDIAVPVGSEIKVKVGQRVKACNTALAKIK